MEMETLNLFFSELWFCTYKPIKKCGRSRALQNHTMLLKFRVHNSSFYFVLHQTGSKCVCIIRCIRVRTSRGRSWGRPTCDQCSKLHSLQDLWHQGLQSEHQLGMPPGRWRSSLRWNVTQRQTVKKLFVPSKVKIKCVNKKTSRLTIVCDFFARGCRWTREVYPFFSTDQDFYICIFY